MKKHPTPILLLLCTILLIGGTAVAYCNTRSFGFDKGGDNEKLDLTKDDDAEVCSQ